MPVILYDIEAGGDFPITGAYKQVYTLASGEHVRWVPCSWNIKGQHRIDQKGSNLDLIGPECWPIYQRMAEIDSWKGIL